MIACRYAISENVSHGLCWATNIWLYLLSFYCSFFLNVFVSCFDRFFRHVNLKENKLISKRRGGFFMDDLNLIGVDYLWRVSNSLYFICDFAGFQFVVRSALACQYVARKKILVSQTTLFEGWHMPCCTNGMDFNLRVRWSTFGYIFLCDTSSLWGLWQKSNLCSLRVIFTP